MLYYLFWVPLSFIYIYAIIYYMDCAVAVRCVSLNVSLSAAYNNIELFSCELLQGWASWEGSLADAEVLLWPKHAVVLKYDA